MRRLLLALLASAALAASACEDRAPPGWDFRGLQMTCEDILALPLPLTAGCAGPLGDWCRASCGRCRSGAALQAPRAADAVPLTVLSDLHVEPWYDVDGSGRVARFDDPSVDNMFQCRDDSGEASACLLNGESDAPVELFEAAVEAAAALGGGGRDGVLFYAGDTDAHDLPFKDDELQAVVLAVMNRTLGTLLDVWRPERVFFAGGNNDGEHNRLFCDGKGDDWDLSVAWAQALVDAGVVDDRAGREYQPHADDDDAPALSQTEHFLETGYYIKAIFPDVYGIVLNTNLADCRHKVLRRAFESDLAWLVAVGAQAYVIGHHPEVVSDLVDALDDDLAGAVVGTLGGHHHAFAGTDKHSFTLCGPITQIGDLQGFWQAGLSPTEPLSVAMSDDLVVYTGEEGEVPEAGDFEWYSG